MFYNVLFCYAMRTKSRARTKAEMWVWSLCGGIKQKMVDVFIIHHRDPYREKDVDVIG